MLWCSGGIQAIQGGKCDQPTQCLDILTWNQVTWCVFVSKVTW